MTEQQKPTNLPPVSVTFSEERGLSLTFAPVPSRPGLLVMVLAGAELRAQAEVSLFPAAPDQRRLDDFLSAAAEVKKGASLVWFDEAQDLRLEAECPSDAVILLRVNVGSTTDDRCDWILHATFQFTPEELHRFAREAARVFQC